MFGGESNLKERVIAQLNNNNNAFNNADPSFFDQFARDATIFTADSAEPIKGRDAYRRTHQAALTGSRREKTVLDRTVQIVGDKAVVAQTAQIRQGGTSALVRQTIVFGDTDEGLKIVHLHTAVVNPNPTGDILGKAGVRVINERIAATAPVLGVAQ